MRNPLLHDALAYDAAQETAAKDTLLMQLNSQQAALFHEVVQATETDPATAHFFLNEAAGTRKTFLLRTLCHHFRSLGKVLLCVASSGIAALLLPGGTTVHKRFRIPIDVGLDGHCPITRGRS